MFKKLFLISSVCLIYTNQSQADCQNEECVCFGATTICLCFANQTGEIGFGYDAGGYGETLTVPIYLHSIGEIDVFGLEIKYPSDIVSFDCALPGNLTDNFTYFGYNELSTGIVRIGAYSGIIPADTTGSIAILRFSANSVGCKTVCITELFDDLDTDNGYFSCGIETTQIEKNTWSMIKGYYRF